MTVPRRVLRGTIQSTYGMAAIEKFVHWCRDNQIQVLATWPNTIWFDSYKEPSVQDAFESIKKNYESLDVPIVGKPEEAMFDMSLFYDSAYHLHDRGVRVRTEQLISSLRPYLANQNKQFPVSKTDSSLSNDSTHQ